MDMIADMWEIILASDLIYDLVESTSLQIVSWVVIGSGVLVILAVPRVVRRIISAAIP